MTVTITPCVKDGCLLVNGKVVFTSVPANLVVSPVASGSAFLGATFSIPSCRHIFSLGVLEKMRFLSLFRCKIWWMIPRVGKLGSEIPMETQLLLLEARAELAVGDDNSSSKNPENTFYILLLPVLDGPFRASLQGTPSNELQFCIESGDAYVETNRAFEAVFINWGDNPFELIKSSIEILMTHKGTFTHIEHKKVPPHLDWFGWCTWDAFYKDVDPEGIREGIERFATRLADIKENSKFRGSGMGSSFTDLHEFVTFIKEKYGLKFVYMWHALLGYWGGLLPSSKTLKKYNPKIKYPRQSPGNVGNLRDVAMDCLEKFGVGLIDPEKVYDFYSDFHSYLASCGVDGVKVDVQNVLETLGGGFGGRVLLTKKYQDALEQSALRNFKNNNIICCMSLNSDSIYSLKRSAVARVSEDFMPRKPTFQTLHVATVAFNSLLLGEIVVPDWDMFQSNHDTAEFHAAARALGGCAVYVSDKPGDHDFKVLRKLVLPDGYVLRARHAGRPTRDCLFTDPVMDRTSLLKIWNMNKFSGIIGAFNCQGAGIWPLKLVTEGISNSEATHLTLSGHVSPLDVEFLGEIVSDNWNGDCAVFAFHSGSLLRLPKEGNVNVSLTTLQYEIYTISPIRIFNQDLQFAPVGLLDMFNSGGAIEALYCFQESSGCKVKLKARGCGQFGAYSNTRPLRCLVDMEDVEFAYNLEDGFLKVELLGDCSLREIEFVY
ncbi:Galactinol--sucrose galactosyltransferase [Bertholletia excelsa]